MSTFVVTNPATGRAFQTLTRASVDEVDAAVARAVVAQRGWAALAPGARAHPQRPVTRGGEEKLNKQAEVNVW